jgi:hypothetical protein
MSPSRLDPPRVAILSTSVLGNNSVLSHRVQKRLYYRSPNKPKYNGVCHLKS